MNNTGYRQTEEEAKKVVQEVKTMIINEAIKACVRQGLKLGVIKASLEKIA